MMITTICSDDDTHCRYQPNLTSWPLPFYCSLTCDLFFFKYDVSMAIIYLLPSTSYRFYVNYYNCLDCLCLFCFRTCHLSNATVVTPAGVYNLKTSCPLPPALDPCTPLVLEYCLFCTCLFCILSILPFYNIRRVIIIRAVTVTLFYCYLTYYLFRIAPNSFYFFYWVLQIV